MSTVAECEAAMSNVAIDDESLVRIFRECVDADALVESSVRRNNERAVRLLIGERFNLSFVTSEGEGITVLHLAYHLASLRIIDLLLSAGLNAEALDSDGLPPWYYAALNSDDSVMAKLMADGVNFNVSNNEGFSLAHCVAGNKNEKVLAMLIAAGADVAACDTTGNTSCHWAAENRNANVMAMLIPLCDVNAVNDDGEPPCLWAVQTGNHGALALLIGAGANINVATNDGKTVGQWAMRHANATVMELLVDAKMDANVVDFDDGWTPMHFAASLCNHGLIRKLIAAGGNVNAVNKKRETPCHTFRYASDPSNDDAYHSIALLIAAKADVNAMDMDGNTPLHCAAMAGFSDCLSLLLKAGANAALKTKAGWTPLFVAKDVASAAVLIAKVDVNAVDKRGCTACHWAFDRPRVLSFLIAAGANAHMKNGVGETALHYAAQEENSIEAMTVLLNAGADVNEGDKNGNCAGHWAASNGRVDNLKFLLARGARINRRNNAGETMLYIATREKHADVVRTLLMAGAAIDVRSEKRMSPFELALMHSLEIAKILLQAGASLVGVGADGNSVCHAAARSPFHAVQSLRLVIDAGANVFAINDFGASVAHGARVSAFPLLRTLGVNLNAVDDGSNTPCHSACDSAAMMALFALGASMTAVNKASLTPFQMFLAKDASDEVDDALLTFVAAGLGVGVQTQLTRADIGAVVVAGGGLVSAQADQAALLAAERAALDRIVARQKQLFRLRALEVCVGLQSQRVSALELCEILKHMFAPLESLVPLHFAWAVVTKVKHKHR